MALVNQNIALAGVPMQVPNFLGMQQTAADTQNTLARTGIMQEEAARESESATYNTALSRSKDALRFVNSPEDYLAWTESSINDPVLGPVLQNMGVDRQKALASAMEMLRQPGGLQTAIGKSASSIDQLAQSMTKQGGQARTQAQAQAKTDEANARQAAANARVAELMGGAAPTTMAQPVPPPVDTMQYAPGTPSAVNQLYAQAGAQPTPALNALTTPPGTGAAPTAQLDMQRARIVRLREAAAMGVPGAAVAADQLEKALEIYQPKRDVGTLVSVVGPDGRPVMVTAAEAVGMTPGSEAEKIPKDYRKTPNGGLEVIPGSPTAKKEAGANKVALETVDAAINTVNELIGPLDKPAYHPGLENATGPFDVKTMTFSTETANAEALIATAQSQASLEGLRSIRGQAGAIGTITEREWPRLESLFFALQASQGTQQFAKNLAAWREKLLNIKNEATKMKSGGGGGGVTVTAPNGQVIEFDSQEAADKFKQATGQ
jgi:hypothetical protein